MVSLLSCSTLRLSSLCNADMSLYCCSASPGSMEYLDFFSVSFRLDVDSVIVSRLELFPDDVGLRTVDALEVAGFRRPHWARLS